MVTNIIDYSITCIPPAKENEAFFGPLNAFTLLSIVLGFFLANADLIAPIINEPYLTIKAERTSSSLQISH
jgi:hypothetical protein